MSSAFSRPARLLLGALLVIPAGAGSAEAQAVDGWSPPHQLSGADGEAGEATMVATPDGTLHAFWAERLPEKSVRVRHRRFRSGTWSAAADLFAQSGGIDRSAVSATITPDGNLHVVWTGGNWGPVYATRAPAASASLSDRWEEPATVDVPAYDVSLVSDSKGVLHLVYSQFHSPTPGVFYVSSRDNGNRWSRPVQIDPEIPADLRPFTIALVADASDGLHLTWHYLRRGASGHSVLYAHSLDAGRSWHARIIDEADGSESELRMARPGIAAVESTVHIVWAGDERTHREHRLSHDRGNTWQETHRILGELHGQAGGDGLVADGRGRLHFMGQIRWPQGIYHAIWSGEAWNEPSLAYLIARDHAEDRGDRIHAHNVRAALVGANRLVAAFTTSPGDPQMILYAIDRTVNDLEPAAPSRPPSPVASRRRGTVPWGWGVVLLLLLLAVLRLRRRR